MNRKKISTWQRIRKLFNDLHLWAGLIGGAFIFIICLSGTILVFEEEILHTLNTAMYEVNDQNQSVKPIEDIINAAEQKTGRKVQSIQIPNDKSDAYSLAISNKEGKGRPESFMVNPYTTELLGSQNEQKGKEFMMTVFKLHRWLLLETETGRPIVGIATLLFLFGSITGLIIWFPNKVKYWKQGLKIMWRANWKRINNDLHNALGFYALVFLLIMGLTGLCWSFEWYRDVVGKVIGTKIFDRGEGNEKKVQNKITDTTSQLMSYEALLEKCNTALAYDGIYQIAIPKKTANEITISKYKEGFFAGSLSDKIVLDKYSGEILKLEKHSDLPFNQKIANSIKALHVGTFMGTFSKIIYFLACLIATSLPITGILIWWNKLKKKK